MGPGEPAAGGCEARSGRIRPHLGLLTSGNLAW